MRTLLALLLGLLPVPAFAQTTTTVTTEAQLQSAIAGATAGDTIVLGADITLTADLPAIAADLRFDGAGHTISGNNQFRGLVVGNLSAGPVPVNVTIQNVSIVNAVAQGGNGGAGAQGGGGGAGFGGALFVAASAQVTLSNVNLTAAQAIGGNGGAGGVAGFTNGGGGGMGGNGGDGSNGTLAGAGGGTGSSATGGNNSTGGTGRWTGAPSGGLGGGGTPGGAQGGGGGADAAGAGGGGANGAGSGSGTGGAGGYGGGGGGSPVAAGAGGFGGGGGGGLNGIGGYGGGGGGSFNTFPAAGGFAGGSGGNSPTAAGGGGAGLGGAIFVDGGGTLTIAGGLSINGSTVTAGLGGTGGANGANGRSGGSGMFFAGSGAVTFTPGVGATQTVTDVIADEAGIGGSANVWSVNKTGAGTLVLSGQNVYGGGTTIGAGTISVSSSGNLGLGAVTIDGGALQTTAGGVYTNTLRVGAGTLNAAAGTSITWSGNIGNAPSAGRGGGQLTVTGGGTVQLTDVANSYSGGTTVVGNSVVVAASDVVLGQPGGGITLGDASSGGTLGITTGGTLTTARTITLGAGGGILDTQGTAVATASGDIGGIGALTKNGTGTLTLSGGNTYAGGTVVNAGTLAAAAADVFGSGGMQVGAGATLDLNGWNQTLASLSGAGTVLLAAATADSGSDNTSTTFSGSISGTGRLTKSGAGTLTLTGANNYSGGTTVNAGTLAGDTASLQGNITNNAQLQFNQAAAGTYTGVISGSGTLTKTGAGTLTVTGANTYTGGTTVSAGTLQGDTVSLRGNILNNASVVFNQAANGTYAGSMSGTGTLVKSGAGTLTLTGTNTQSGGTTILGGTAIGTSTSFGAAILNNASVVFNEATAGTFTGPIAGTGSLTKSGAGSLTLAGTSSYSGGTFITAGTLIGTTQSLQGAIANNAQLVFAQNFDGASTSSIGGAGSLLKTGSGTVFLNGTNSYTGGTTVSAGTLAGTSTSLQGAILNNAAVMFAQPVNGTYSGVMSGSGALFKTGAGTLTLTGANSYAGGTVVTGGAVAIAQDAALGGAGGGISLGDAVSSGGISFTNAAQLTSLRSVTLGSAGGVFNTTGATVTLSGGISGSGGLTKIGAGVLELAHSNSYTGPTVVSEGTLRSSASNGLGNGSALLVSAGASVDLNGFAQSVSSLSGGGSISLGSATLTAGANDADGAFAGSISGSGSLTKIGSGTLALTGTNTYTGGTNVLGGSLLGTSTSLPGNILNNGTVVFDQNTDGSYSGSMSGSGRLMKSGAGLLTLNGNNTYTGGTVIAGGAIVSSPTGLSGAILNNGSLIFDGASSGVFTGIVGGTGSVTKTGAGTMTMSSAQALTGLTSVAQGTLIMNGGTAGGVDVAAGATLRATGFIGGSLTLRGSLIAAPAAAPFTLAALQSTDSLADALTGAPVLTIGNTFTALNGSRVTFDVGPGSNPTLLVGGSASLNGVHFDIAAPSIGNQRSGTFLAVQALNGLSFLNSNVAVAQPNVEPLLTQTQNSLYVTLLNLNVPLAIDAGPARKAVADAIDRSKFGATGDAAAIIRELTALDTGGLQEALELLAGELHASVLHAAILDAETLADVVRDQLSSREVEEGNDFRWWGETVCQHADFEESTRARGGTANVCAGAGGGDRRFSSKWTLGFGGSWTDGALRLGQLGSGDYSAPRAFGYAGYKPRNFGVRFGGSGAKSNYQTNRRIQFQAFLPPELGGLPLDQGVNRKAEAGQDGNTSDEWGEIHDSRKLKTYTLEGLLGVRHARISRAAFAESGAIAISLDGADEILNLTQTDVKAHLWRREGTYRPFADFSYRRELAEDGTQAAMRFDGLPTSDFIVEGINIPASSYSLRGGMTIALPFGQATATYEYKRAQGQRRQLLGFRMRFK